MTSFDNAVPIVNQPFYYINGFNIFNDATTPNTLLDIAAGQCRDSTNTYDINLGNYNGENNTGTANSITVINAANNGLNGLDTGTLAEATMYYVYVVGDAVQGNPTGVMISKAVPSVGPLMPFGYNVFRHIGYAPTISNAAHFLPFYQSGNNNARLFVYDAPQATAVTAGNATSATAIDLSAFVPTLPINTPVMVYYSYDPATAGNTLSLQPVNATGFPVVITGQVASVHVTGVAIVQAQIVAAGTKPEINYKVGNSSDAVAIDVGGFYFYI